jgi:hypothetical protein
MPMSAPQFKASLYNLNLFLEILFSLKNLSKNDWYVLTWFTPLEAHNGVLCSDCFNVTCEGKSMNYRGIMMKPGMPTRESYFLIKSGETITQKIYMNSYDCMPGECIVELNCSITDYVLKEDELTNTNRDEVEPIPLVCEPCYVNN